MPTRMDVTVPFASSAEQQLRELETLGQAPALSNLSGEQLLMERALLTGARFTDGQTPGGNCRFLATGDNTTIAVNLPRQSDWELINAWLATERSVWNWDDLTLEVAGRDVQDVVARGRLLGLAVAKSAVKSNIFPAQKSLKGNGW